MEAMSPKKIKGQPSLKELLHDQISPKANHFDSQFNPKGGVVAVSMTAQGFNQNNSVSAAGGSKDYIKSMREKRLM